ncbi:MAG: hypothetical protein Q8M24_20190 [Pseudolabrys sp.]|nr:hypothetical protein [Pseudolabrys sp.]MDP2297770.1 hypothetical protein [Pseudolabrys sp.]
MTNKFSTKTASKTFAAALAALTVAGTIAATSGEAQARPRHGTALGIGIVAGTLIGMAAASHAYAGPTYVTGPGYRDCRYVERYNRWGHLRVVKVCDAVPY